MRWQLYTTPGGNDVVRKEIDALPGLASRHGKARLRDLLERIAERRTLPRDVKHLEGGLLEARLTHDRSEYRLLYSEVQGKRVLLGLRAFQKKTQKTPDRHLDVARDRLAEFLDR